MPNCFRLINKKTGEVETLNNVDRMFCEQFGLEFDDKWYGGGVYNWHDNIGWGCAMWGVELGTLAFRRKWWDWIWPTRPVPDQESRLAYLSELTDEEVEAMKAEIKVLDWFVENFRDESWVEIGRR